MKPVFIISIIFVVVLASIPIVYLFAIPEKNYTVLTDLPLVINQDNLNSIQSGLDAILIIKKTNEDNVLEVVVKARPRISHIGPFTENVSVILFGGATIEQGNKSFEKRVIANEQNEFSTRVRVSSSTESRIIACVSSNDYSIKKIEKECEGATIKIIDN